MNRRSFMISMAAVSAPRVLGRASWCQSSPAKSRSSASARSAAIRKAAAQFMKTLAVERQARISYPFPLDETPVLAKFPRQGGPGGPHGLEGHNGPNGSFSPQRPPADGVPGGPNGTGRPGDFGPPGDFAFIGEKFGKSVWSNFPVSDVQRPGLRMGEMSDAEQNAVHALLQTVLSPMGYQKVLNIMAADQTLAEAGTPYVSGYDAYTIALFGQPAASSPWMLQFGGHHLGLNVIFVGDKAVCAPLHTGILPSKFTKDGKTIRGLGPENDKAFDLVGTFTPTQLDAARIDHDISDLVFGPGHPDARLVPVGVLGSAMTEPQRQMLFSLACEWACVLNDDHIAERLQEIRRSLPETRFAWSGPTTHEKNMNGESYFRIHGPSILIEHAPQGNQGGYKLHVHTVMRDLGNDYAKSFV